MTTRRRHAAPRARMVVAAVSASMTAALVGGMAADDRSAKASAPAPSPTPDGTAVVPSLPAVHLPSSPPVTTSHAS